MTCAPNRRTLLAGIAGLSLAGLAACSGKKDDATPAEGGSSNASASGTRTVTDATGAKVEVPNKPSKVVVLHYAGTEAMMDLGLTPIGTGPAGQGGGGSAEDLWVPANLWSKLKDVPVVVSDQQEPQVEKIAELEPDLILAHNVTKDDVLSQLQKIAPVYRFTLRGGERKNWQKRVEEIADALNRKSEFDALKTAWEKELKDAAAKYADVTKGLSVGVFGCYEEGNFYAWGEDNMQGTILTPLGFTWSAKEEAAVKGEKEPEKSISNEKVLDTLGDAKILFFDSNLKGQASPTMEAFQKTPLYKQLPAVTAGHAYPFGKNTVAGFSDARYSLEQVTKALDAFKK